MISCSFCCLDSKFLYFAFFIYRKKRNLQMKECTLCMNVKFNLTLMPFPCSLKGFFVNLWILVLEKSCLFCFKDKVKRYLNAVGSFYIPFVPLLLLRLLKRLLFNKGTVSVWRTGVCNFRGVFPNNKHHHLKKCTMLYPFKSTAYY